MPPSRRAASPRRQAKRRGGAPPSSATLFELAVPVGTRSGIERRARRLLDLHARDDDLVFLAVDLDGRRHRRRQEAAALDDLRAILSGVRAAAAVQVTGGAGVLEVNR